MHKQITAVSDKELADKLEDRVIILDKWTLRIIRDPESLAQYSALSGTETFAIIEANVDDDIVKSIISDQISSVTKGYIYGLMGIKG